MGTHDVQNPEHVFKADKRIRTIVIIAWIACVLVGLILLRWVVPWGQDQLKRVEPAQALRIMQIIIAFIFLSTIPFSACLYWFGRQVIKYRQMPPPGMRVIRTTRILDGHDAVKRGRMITGIALLLLVIGLAGGLYMPYKLGKVFGERNRQTQSDATQSSP